MANENFSEELGRFVPKSAVIELYKAVVKQIFQEQPRSHAEGKKELLNLIQTENDLLAKARRLLLDDAIDSADYKIRMRKQVVKPGSKAHWVW